ncbi:TAXI family TRAP transporter solute-binding subunit [Agromyces archimandritae]|uniref:TAXI family TRAP transporter solute-binding subunit n=1 Tax=Agromyces archimandritae TaxID=2781962 RepID=A0A975FQH4_9MICO|nr:TAXI family TRAP transporter solute-binding subunit [Agromyces archimandritae]QTX05848.1 TAXI family TRAP transporter solute-binding subunit [Agromyces archimandritae]
MTTTTKRAIGFTAAALATALALTGCGGQQQRAAESPEAGSGDGCTAPAAQLTIATGNSTGVYYVLGGAIADLLSSDTELRVTAAETGASVQNIEQLVAGDYDIAFSLADTAADAIQGTGSFSEEQPIAALGRIHTNSTQVIVRKDAGIASVEDMKGKTVSTGSPKSGTEVIANRLLEAAGLDPAADVSAQRLDLSSSVDGLRNGNIDAIFWSGGLPTPNITELFTTDAGSVEFIDITPLLDGMHEFSPVYEEGTIPADTYGLDGDVKTIIVPNMLLVRDDMDDATACGIDTAIWGNIDRLEQVHASAGEFDPETAQQTDPVPLNKGAEEALKELAE